MNRETGTVVMSIILGVLIIVLACFIASAVRYDLKGEAHCQSLGYATGGGNKLNANCYQLVLVAWEE